MGWAEDALKAAAKLLVTTGGLVAIISSADIQKQAEGILKNYPHESALRIRSKIEEEIKTFRR
ncbi:hypothetical protein [Glutamicibacter ardleyensis]|uniref:hypothetical protein n=1 Tax=Glutamicibacter ardleyensis TaxID=225894 RepID=UPI003FD49B65